MINEIVRKVVDDQWNKPMKSFGFSYQQFRCNKCGSQFDTKKGGLIHIAKKHKKPKKMKKEIKTTLELLDDFHKVWGKKSDFVTKSDYIDKVKYKKWVSDTTFMALFLVYKRWLNTGLKKHAEEFDIMMNEIKEKLKEK